MNTIGKRIVYVRELRDLKQKDLASIIGVTKSTMSKYENDINVPNADILRNIAEALQTSTDYLVGRTDCFTPYNDTTYSYSPEKMFEIILKLNEDNKRLIFVRAITLIEKQKNKEN